jgi:HK97 family phage prohead protease
VTSRHVRRLEARLDRTAHRYADAAAGRPITVAELRATRLPWFELRDAADTAAADAAAPVEDGVTEVLIFDEIGGSFGVDASALVEGIALIDSPTIRVRINSPGGSVFDALAIMNALNHHDARVEVFVDALAASAATVVAMAGDEVVMMPGSQMMIHDASATHEGNAAEAAKLSTFLDRQSNNIAQLYAARAGGDVEQWRALMLEETWLFADEAVAAGLADRAEPAPQPAGEARGFDLAGYGFRYAGRRAAPAPALELERRASTALTRHTAARGVEARRRPQEQTGRRFGDLTRVEVRTEDDGSIRVRGHAAVFDIPTMIGPPGVGFEEIIAPGAFTKTLRDGADVRFLFNHNPDLILARTKPGTLALTEDGRGLAVDAHLAPTSTGRDLAILLGRGDVSQMSFGFRAVKDRWTTERRDDGSTVERRTVLEAQLLDVSGVTYAAYDETDLAIREASLARELRSVPTQKTPQPRPGRTAAAASEPAPATPQQYQQHGGSEPTGDVDERSLSPVDLMLRHAGGAHASSPRALCPACSSREPATATPA